MKTKSKNKQTTTKRTSLNWLNRFVIACRGNRNRAVWWTQEIKRRRKCLGFRGWMVKRFGVPEHGLGCSWNWRVNGVLCTVWTDPMRLKIYEDSERNTTSYELTKKWDNGCARDHVLNLLSDNLKVKSRAE